MTQLKYVFLIIGTLIGAGFATGKELMVYFANQGIYFYIEIFIVLFLLYYLIFKILKLANNNIFINKNKINIFFIIIYLIFSSSMFAGLRNFLIIQQLNINLYIIDTIIILISYLILKKGLKNIIKINNVCTPLLILFYIIVIIIGIINNGSLLSNINYDGNIILAISNGITYPFINLMVCIFVLLKIGKDKNAKPKTIALLTSIIICVMIFIGVLCLQNAGEDITSSSMPFIEMIKYSNVLTFIYSFVIIISILTTLFTCLFSFYEIMQGFTKSKFIIPICLFSVYFVSLLGFSSIVEYAYKFIGYIGCVVFVLLSSESFFKFTNSKIHKSS